MTGYRVIRNTNLDRLPEIISHYGTQIRVFEKFPMWKPILIDPDRPKNRNGGTGLIGLHIDFVNAEFPPDYAVFYCTHTDPNGGGSNIVARIDGIEDELSTSTVHALMGHHYDHGKIYDLNHVGRDINPFAMINTTGWKYRYGDGILDTPATREVHDILWNRVETVTLDVGDALIIDQRTHLHGRLPLHGDQRSLTQRRELLSTYIRA